MKSCFKCNIVKPATEFYFHGKMKDLSLNKCKECTKSDVRRNKTDYGLTEKGVIRVIFKTQKRNQYLRGFGSLPYTKVELAVWLYKEGFKHYFDEWANSSFQKDYKPSVDRINSLEGYHFENIRLVTWLENREAQYQDVRNGTGSGGARCKPVIKMNKNREVVGRFVSYWSASRDCGYSLEYQLKLNKPCRNGYFYAYDNLAARVAA